MEIVVLGSGPGVVAARDWPRCFGQLLAINNAWRVRPDWDALIHPWDFPEERRPEAGPGQRLVTQEEFVPAQNLYGGFVYAGGTMAFTAGYWALAQGPRVIAMLGCDMHYPAEGQTHFYGTGTPDPLRADISLRCLEAKAARLMVLAALEGCAAVNLSAGPSRLVFPRIRLEGLRRAAVPVVDDRLAAEALALEAQLGYLVPSGRYWEEAARFDPQALDAVDALWLAAARVERGRIAS